MISIDENRRRYYLDAMGIQCWQLAEQPSVEQSSLESIVDETVESKAAINAETTTQELTDIDWPQLTATVSQCRSCELHRSRVHSQTGADAVGIGNTAASLMFVLMSPGSDGDLLSVQGRNLFEKMLAAIGLSMDEIYLTCLLKCTVPENHTVSTAEVFSCQSYLKQQIRLLQPKRVVVLGDTAARCLLQKNIALDDLRELYNAEASEGKMQLFEDISIFVSYSPEELLLQSDNKRKAWTDLQQLKKIIDCN